MAHEVCVELELVVFLLSAVLSEFVELVSLMEEVCVSFEFFLENIGVLDSVNRDK
jgi:hypothetical protein